MIIRLNLSNFVTKAMAELWQPFSVAVQYTHTVLKWSPFKKKKNIERAGHITPKLYSKWAVRLYYFKLVIPGASHSLTVTALQRTDRTSLASGFVYIYIKTLNSLPLYNIPTLERFGYGGTWILTHIHPANRGDVGEAIPEAALLFLLSVVVWKRRLEMVA